MRFRLRTLVIVMLLGGPICALAWKAWNWTEWQVYREARESIAARRAELNWAKARSNGSRAALAGVRHSELRLKREDDAARRRSVLYRNLTPAVR